MNREAASLCRATPLIIGYAVGIPNLDNPNRL